MARSASRKNNRSQPVYVYSRIYQRYGVRPYFKLHRHQRRSSDQAEEQLASWSVPAICDAYDWPTDQPGGGVIAIVELGGGWQQSDMDQYFAQLGQPLPKITDVSVDDLKNSPDPAPDSADGEVALDIQVAAAAYFAATGSPATIRVYWSRDIAAAVRAATADGCDICSISWGSDEANWRAEGLQAALDLEQAAAEATAAGMVVLAASGDNDSSDGGHARANVDLPAAAPHVIGCGGTRKTASTEIVWNNNPGNPDGHGTGGGFSKIFPMPGWQAGAPHGPGRMVPDVAANADPETGYEIFYHGAAAVVGGTSAVAPLYAGLFASFGRKLGFVTPELWSNHLCFNDVTEGDNGTFRARIGPDACTGIGSPIGTRLSRLLHPSSTALRQLKEFALENERLRALLLNVISEDGTTSARDLIEKLPTLNSHMARPAVSARAPTGCCTVVFHDGRPDLQERALTDDQCQRLAARMGGVAQPIDVGSPCL